MGALALARSPAAPPARPVAPLRGLPKPTGTRTVFRDDASPLQLPAATEAEVAEELAAAAVAAGAENHGYEGGDEAGEEDEQGGVTCGFEVQGCVSQTLGDGAGEGE